jgi:antitoxin ParD1/3/4
MFFSNFYFSAGNSALLQCVLAGMLGNMTTVTITLRDEDQRFIEAAMKAGRYVTESEAVSDAIAELRAREDLRQARLGELRTKVMFGIEQLDRGEGSPWNVEDIKAKGQALLESRESGA